MGLQERSMPQDTYSKLRDCTYLAPNAFYYNDSDRNYDIKGRSKKNQNVLQPIHLGGEKYYAL